MTLDCVAPPPAAPLYVARFPGPFAALVQATTLAGMRLEPLPAARVRDVFWDTPDARLLRAGLALRVRETDAPAALGMRRASLRAVGDGTEPLAEATLPAADVFDPALRLPAGPLADALAVHLGDGQASGASLTPLLVQRRFHTPRLAFDGARPAAVVSLDVVVSETGASGRVTHEADLDATADGGPADLIRLDPALREHGLEAVRYSAFERGVQALVRPAGAPLRLLPDERDALSHLAERGAPALRRRARALLLASRGTSVDAIARQVGVPEARVEHWAAQFADRRLDAVAAEARVYRIQPLVDARAPALRDASDVPFPAPGTGGDGVADVFRVDDLGDSPASAPVGGTDAPVLEVVRPSPVVTVAPPASAAPLAAPRRAAVPLPGTFEASTPLVRLAADVWAARTAAVLTCAEALAAQPRTSTAQALFDAADDARVALDALAPVLPAEAAARLRDGLRPLAVALGQALDAERAALLGTPRTAELVAARDAHFADARGHLGALRTVWSARARRLAGRLRAQDDAGVLVPDDAPLPPDDWRGDAASRPAPTHLAHAAGTLLGPRLVAVRVATPRLDEASAADPAVARHVADALDALAFTAGLFSSCDADTRAALDACRHRLTTAADRVVARQLAGLASSGDLAAALREVQRQTDAPAFRAAIAECIAA